MVGYARFAFAALLTVNRFRASDSCISECARTVTNNDVLIVMGSAAQHALHQVRNQPWERSVHTNRLQKLTEDRCPLVVFDVFFRLEGKEAEDAELAAAIQRQGHVVLATKVIEPKYQSTEIAQGRPAPKMVFGAAAGCGGGEAR